MKRYFFKRLLLVVPMLLGISLIMFLIMHLAPGDPASIRYGLNPEMSEDARVNFNRMYGLDQPALSQYLLWLRRFLVFDFGRSFIDDSPVMDKILTCLPATIMLQAVSFAVIFLISLPVGILSAVKKDSLFDRTATVLVFIGYAIPTFWLALLLIFFFSFRIGFFPISGMVPWYTPYLSGFDRIKDLLWHMVLPVATTALGGIAGLSRYVRSSMIDAMNEHYILTARAKGLTEKRIITVHAFRNALLPIVTILGLTLPGLISGSFIVETIFAWPGMGRLGYDAIMSYDYPMVMGVGVIATFLTLIGIFISDMLYAFVDPRIRFGVSR